VGVAEPCPDEQIGLGHEDNAADLARLIDHLSARLGPQRVRRFVAHDSHIPELAAASAPAQSTRGDTGWEVMRGYRAEHGSGPRPLRMFARPEPIQAIAQVPDGPPERFWWRGAQHEVVAVEGPERIEAAWWSDSEGKNPARDYFRVEDKTGLRFWLFRAGLYRSLSQADWDAGRFPGWYMHGAFA